MAKSAKPAKPKRKTMPQRIRFEVFHRDGNKCRYCGNTAEVAALRVDHVVPIAKGGTDEPDNLVTACFDCNSGKSDRPGTPVARGPGRGPGRPWKPGESGNPEGRPKLSPEQKEQRIQAQAVIDAFSPDAAWALVEQLTHFDPKTRQAAADSILDRASITGIQRLQVTGADGGPVDFDLKQLTDEQLRQFRTLAAIAARKREPIDITPKVLPE